MKLVLVAGFKPSVQAIGPNVLLYKGWWKIVSERVVDSKLVLVHQGSGVAVQNGTVFKSHGGQYHLSVESGTEDYINVFAEVTNGPDFTADEG